MSMRPSGAWRLRVAGALTAGLFLAYLIALPPHLVHHLSDDDHGRPTCPHLVLSQHTPAAQTDTPTVAPPAASDTLDKPRCPVFPPSPAAGGGDPRAPPRSAPSA